jgi:hypothetical protein
MARSRVVLLALAVVAAAAASAGATPKKGARPKPPKEATKEAPKDAEAPAAADDQPAEGSSGAHSEGDYGGVAPGRPPHQEPGHKKRPPSKGTLSWIGFEAKNGSAEVFFQSVGPFEVTQRVENSTLVVNLGGLTRLGQNTWRMVDAHFFETPLEKIFAKYVGAARASKAKPAHGAGIEVRITFKNAKDAHEGSLRTATEADGMYYSYLSFAGTGGQGGGTIQEPEK